MASMLCKVCRRRDTQAMYRFPTKVAAATSWKLALEIPEAQNVSNNFVCYQHFPSEKIEAVLKISYSLKDKDGKSIIKNQWRRISEKFILTFHNFLQK